VTENKYLRKLKKLIINKSTLKIGLCYEPILSVSLCSGDTFMKKIFIFIVLSTSLYAMEKSTSVASTQKTAEVLETGEQNNETTSWWSLLYLPFYLVFELVKAMDTAQKENMQHKKQEKKEERTTWNTSSQPQRVHESSLVVVCGNTHKLIPSPLVRKDMPCIYCHKLNCMQEVVRT
jgi:hypothetical protein